MCIRDRYIGNAKELKSLLILSKLFYRKLKRRIYKQVARLQSVMNTHRCRLWLSLFPSLNLTSLQQKYSKIKEERLKSFQTTNKYIDDKISLDVARSFHVYGKAVQSGIANVLRCYAVYNPELIYYQGMNFLAGIFYLVSKDEGVAFALFSELIRKNGLSNIYKEGMPLLKLYLFQTTKLLAIFLPKLHRHLTEEGANLQHLCSPWFFTSFTFILQQTNEPVIPPLVESIFDRFLIVSVTCDS
eukprot:TRINITY_DN14097_c0_g1_i2.p1 TRINITY_DN14097_c0_g1~~TRINITY_DN14097_c0_g1_i2.p1  ORF type:complete len:243 (-),score=27.99 TRINITY_DN14097_c0_g1_i2:184-912(-)